MNNRLQNPLKWHGGKFYLASKIVELMPAHLHYVEPFAGGLATLLFKSPEGTSEVVNDLNGDLTNFWRVLQDVGQFEKFSRIIEATPFSEVEWEESKQQMNSKDPVRRAAAFFIFCRQSLSGRMRDFTSITRNRIRRGMNEQASAWMTAVDGLPKVHARLRRVVVLNRPAITVIQEQDGPNTLFYLDPPYVHETRTSKTEYGDQEMSLDEHERLIDVVLRAKGKFMISMYRHRIYDALVDQHKWNRVDFSLPNNAAGGATKRRMTECLWMNFSPTAD